MAFVVGLIVEGVTDLPIIEGLLRAAFDEAALSIELRCLQPAYDNTSGRWTEGGYQFVRAWCARHDAESRRDGFLRPLFEGDSSCDALLFHLDGAPGRRQ